MKTWAPFWTKGFAEAKPTPSVPPVTTAILPSSLGDIFSPLLLRFAEFSTLQCFHRSPRPPFDRLSAVSISSAESSPARRHPLHTYPLKPSTPLTLTSSQVLQ